MWRLLIKRKLLLIFLLTLIGIFLRFYHLNWGAPFYFHPDERNIMYAVAKLHYPDQLNPNFFAYGSLPIYTIYFTGVLINGILKLFSLTAQASAATVTFEQGIIISRLFSAIFSSLLIPIMFLIGIKIKNKQTGITAAILTTFSVGFIQYAHFGTFEMWLTFFTVVLFWLCLKIIHDKNSRLVPLTGVIFGILIATKVSHLALLPLPLLVIFFVSKKHSFLQAINNSITFLAIAAIVYILTNPFVILATSEFTGSMRYESSVALGTLKVFYTGGFENTVPVLYQVLHVYPFLLNPVITVLFFLAFCYSIYKMVRTRKSTYLLLNSFFLILFLSQAVLYVKWVRYMVPTLPFIYLMVSLALTDFLHKTKQKVSARYILNGFLILGGSLIAYSYIHTAFITPDSRISALNFAKLTIPVNAPVITEPYDMGITPFNSSFQNMEIFNFYELDNKSYEFNPQTLEEKLNYAQYIILPSQRLMKTRLDKADVFPNGYKFYNSLFGDNAQFRLIYQTPCDFFCKITYLNSPVFSFEETANVFDRPEVFIFKKM